ncbi:Gaa1-like protein [Fomitiporia mediterranea MF3/22]|uniref:Gaa1-like protein n=1 Tax=Fomitiporia mediterranea (strain MF3/22) TaxID=694068 RepID=UPI00044072D3|nr:Gaa1-like protein [Fomitiporia mediterranea MF3/22]EJD02421.1 Gaa1-like protein [Fomitiporia mediterranea MF3/22]
MRNARVRRRRAMSSFLARRLPYICALLYIIGYLWLLIIPSSLLGRGVYIDENALQPNQVNTYWNWAEVHRADLYLNDLEKLRDRNATGSERAEHLKHEFEKLGLHAATQEYTFTTASESISGMNAYAIFSAPRTSGTEAMVISASWASRMGEGSLNLRGVATILALASHLRRYSHWARDIIFVVGDDHLPGMQAWLSAYHAEVQANLDVQPLEFMSGVIWTSLNIDYPGHSFSHLGVFHEGLNGRLPNQDLINSFQIIAQGTGGVPVVLYDHLDPRDSDDKSYPPAWVPALIRNNPTALDFSVRARNIARHMYYQASGKGSGVHALYHRYRINAITLFAVPAHGPHGFFTLGKTVESTLRTMNNLLERLHASFYFYILTTPRTFLKIGHYLPSVILISVATMFTGLRTWVNAGWRREATEKKSVGDSDDEWIQRRRPVLNSLLVMLATHAIGAIIFLISWKGWLFSEGFFNFTLTPTHVGATVVKLFVLSNLCAWLSYRMESSSKSIDVTPPSEILQALTLCITSTLISVMSLLNFSLAALLCVVLILPLILFLPSSSDSRMYRDIKHMLLVIHSMFVLAISVNSGSLWDWSVLGVWYAPFMSIVCVPILLQAAIVCALS